MASDLVERLQRRAENGRVFHTERKLFGEAAAALAEQSRLNAEKEAEAYRRGVEDAAKVAMKMYVRDAFRFEFGHDVAAAIRSLPTDKGDAP